VGRVPGPQTAPRLRRRPHRLTAWSTPIDRLSIEADLSNTDRMITKSIPGIVALALLFVPGHASAAVELPGAPGTPIVRAGDTVATVVVPAPTTGGDVDTFTVTASPGGAQCTIDNATAPTTTGRVCTVTGLDNGTDYTFSATATNVAGTSAASTASDVATPAVETLLSVARADMTYQCSTAGGVLSPDGEYLYTVEPNPADVLQGRIAKIRTSDMTIVSSSAALDVLSCTYPRFNAVIDPTGEIMVVAGYYGIAKVALNGSSDDAPTLITEQVSSDRGNGRGAAIDPTGTSAYFVTTPTVTTVRIDSATLTIASSEVFNGWYPYIVADDTTGYVHYKSYEPSNSSIDDKVAMRTFPLDAASADAPVPGTQGIVQWAVNPFVIESRSGSAILSPPMNGFIFMGSTTVALSRVRASAPTGATDLSSMIPTECNRPIYALNGSADGTTLLVGITGVSPLSENPGCLIRFTVDPTTGALSDPVVSTVLDPTLGQPIVNRPNWFALDTDGELGYAIDAGSPVPIHKFGVRTPPLGLPDGVEVTASDPSTGGSLDLSWTAPSGTDGLPITGYLVEIATSPEGPWTTVDGSCASATTSTETSCTIDGLTDGTTYYTRVAPLNAAGATEPDGRLASDPTTPTGPPAAPPAPSVEPGDGRLDLEWSAPSNTGGSSIIGYRVEIATSPDGPWTDPAGTCAAATTTTSTATACTITGLDNGTTYYARVAAITEIGETEPSTLTASSGTVPTDGSGDGGGTDGSGDGGTTDGGTDPSDGVLPATGDHLAPWTLGAVLLLGLGSALTMVGRRRTA
jgi:hypothetical protein